MAETLTAGRLTCQWSGGTLHRRTTRDELHALCRLGMFAALERALEAGKALGAGRTVLVVNTFERSTRYQPVSAVLPDRHGARCRLSAAGPVKAVAVVVCREGETPDSLAAALAGGARALAGGPARADPAGMAAAAAGLAASVQEAGFAGTLDEFAEAVAAEAGPAEDPGDWWQALLAAEAAGLVYRTGGGFVPVSADPPPADPHEDATVAHDGKNGKPRAARSRPPAPAAAPAPAATAAPAADDQILAAFGGLEAVVKTIQRETARRAKLAAAAARAEAKAAQLRAKLAASNERLAAAKSQVNLDALMAFADALTAPAG